MMNVRAFQVPFEPIESSWLISCTPGSRKLEPGHRSKLTSWSQNDVQNTLFIYEMIGYYRSTLNVTNNDKSFFLPFARALSYFRKLVFIPTFWYSLIGLGPYKMSRSYWFLAELHDGIKVEVQRRMEIEVLIINN